MNVKIIDRGWKRIKKTLFRLDGSYTKVGLPEKAKIVSRPGSKVVNMSDLVLVGAVHEFGAPKAGRNRNINIPERSWLRSSFDESQTELLKFQEYVKDKIYTNRIDENRALGLIGEFMTKKVQQKIVDIKTPPNSPATIKNKTRAGKVGDNPLIDTGQFRQSINHIEVIK